MGKSVGNAKVAFVFAGQGAQYEGMGKTLYESSPAAKAAMDQAERIRPGTLRQCFEGTLSELSQTINTQPCLFLVDYACALAANEAGVKADMVAGFSLGEVAAAAYAGLMSFEDAFRLVIRRAERMQAAAEKNPGKMAAVLRLTADQVTELAAEFDGVYPVNFNCPGQTVVASKAESFDAFCAKVATLRGRAMPLNVSGAFHSPLMKEASEGLLEDLASVAFKHPSIPIYANLTAEPYAGDIEALKKTLSDQVQSPVQWQKTIERMKDAGAAEFIEVGAGATLSGLIRKIDTELMVNNVQDEASLQALKQQRTEG